MNKIDKELQKALTFFANTPVHKINYLATDHKKVYRNHVSWKIEKYIVYSKYINVEDNKKNHNQVFAINETGLEVLRRLDDIKLKDKTFFVSISLSVIAIIISTISLWVK